MPNAHVAVRDYGWFVIPHDNATKPSGPWKTKTDAQRAAAQLGWPLVEPPMAFAEWNTNRNDPPTLGGCYLPYELGWAAKVRS